MKCRACKTDIVEFFSLGDMPRVNSYLSEEQLKSEKKNELAVGFCPNCYLVQLMQTIQPDELFTHYLYFSSASTSFLKHCEENALFFKEKLGLDKDSLVLEIASNDGAQLQYFKKFGIRILGIDPAKNIAKIANEHGIKTTPEFFNLAFAHKLARDQNNMADLVYGANVLAHVPDIVDFIKGVKAILKPKGTASFEFPYLRGLLENKFDTIYDEHFFYYGILSLVNLFRLADLKIYDLKITPLQGGSLQLLISHPGVFAVSEKVGALVEIEKQYGYDKIEIYKKMSSNVARIKDELVGLLNRLKSDCKHIAAYSAPAKGNVLLNYFGINGNYLDFIVDKSEAKQGYYTPGTHMLIHPLNKIYEENPDYLLILCWNIADEVLAMPELEEYRKAGGKFIIPIPEVRVVG